MRKSGRFMLVFVTAPERRTARRLARAALAKKLVACANLVPGLESHYWWQGKMEKANEVLILFKTTVLQLRPLQDLILEQHPYDTPEFVVVRIAGGSPKYLEWLGQAVG